MNCIDCHCHLLPGVDDGSKSVEESLRALRLLRSQGVGTAVLTPHVNSAYASLPGVTGEDIRKAFAALKRACGEDSPACPELILGCEYYLDPDEEALSEPIPMGESQYVLTELPYTAGPEDVKKAVRAVRAQGYKVILAHPEKYDGFQTRWEEALAFLRENNDVKVQIEAWDIAKGNEYTWRFIESGAADVIGTDSHGDHRPPVYDRAADTLRSWAGNREERLSYVRGLLYENARQLFIDAPGKADELT